MSHPYASKSYAALLQGEGSVVPVPEAEVHLIRRVVDGGGTDLVGAYPRTPVPVPAAWPDAWGRLREAGHLSVVLVTDPLSSADGQALQAHFPVARPFKTHLIHEVSSGSCRWSKHHAYEVRRALREVRVEEIRGEALVEDWLRLYGGLVERHRITGVQRFSEEYHRGVLRMDGLRAFAAKRDGRVVAAHLWFVDGARAWSHLGASDAEGYAARAAYAVYDASLRALAEDADVVDIGGAAGLSDDQGGLFRFKAGFANARAEAWLCGAMLDTAACAARCAARGVPLDGGFFPPYRSPAPGGG